MKVPKFLYKYEGDNEKSLQNLFASRLYFRKPAELNDPFEFKIRKDKIELTRQDIISTHQKYLKRDPSEEHFFSTYGKQPNAKFVEDITTSFKKAIRNWETESRNRRGVTCFSENNKEILMWSHYADSHAGICLKFDTSYPTFEKVFKVNYSDDLPVINPVNFMTNGNMGEFRKMGSLKFTKWEYEREWRLIHEEGDKLYYYEPDALSAIYCGCKIKTNTFEMVQNFVREAKLKTKIYTTTMSETGFSVDFTEVHNNCFQGTP